MLLCVSAEPSLILGRHYIKARQAALSPLVQDHIFIYISESHSCHWMPFGDDVLILVSTDVLHTVQQVSVDISNMSNTILM